MNGRGEERIVKEEYWDEEGKEGRGKGKIDQKKEDGEEERIDGRGKEERKGRV